MRGPHPASDVGHRGQRALQLGPTGTIVAPSADMRSRTAHPATSGSTPIVTNLVPPDARPGVARRKFGGRRGLPSRRQVARVGPAMQWSSAASATVRVIGPT